jgi:phosphatidate cytidylyltransferase
MNSLGKRIATAAVLVVMVLSVLFLLPPVGAAVFVCAVFLMGCWEWSGFLRQPLWIRLVYLAVGVALAWLINAQVAGAALRALLYGAVVWWLLVTAWLAWRDIRYGAMQTAIAGFLCLLPAWAALLLILAGPRGTWLVIWVVCIVAAADTGAYFTGKAWGRHKLAPLLSPGKTREGFAGGLCAAALVAGGGAWLLNLSPGRFLLAGPLIAAVSVVGDLTVSAFKRNAGLKDTGWILPGHGGVLDRIDSLVAAAPLFVLVLSLSGVIVV